MEDTIQPITSVERERTDQRLLMEKEKPSGPMNCNSLTNWPMEDNLETEGGDQRVEC